MTAKKSGYDFVLQELKILSELNHPNCLWLHEIIDDPKKNDLYLITEFHASGSINDLVKEETKKNNGKPKGLVNKVCRLYLIDMLKALHYCHNVVELIHRDIKPDNIMINHNNEAILIDFGVSGLLEDK